MRSFEAAAPRGAAHGLGHEARAWPLQQAAKARERCTERGWEYDKENFPPVHDRRGHAPVVLERVAYRAGQLFEAHRQSCRCRGRFGASEGLDRKSTRLNSSHLGISYAVFCLKKKKQKKNTKEPLCRAHETVIVQATARTD